MGWFGRGGSQAKPLRLIAQSAEDLPALSALVQDAALRAGDMNYAPAGRHFTLRMNRFCHEAALERSGASLRAPAVLRISCVQKVQVRGIDPKRAAQALALLDISAEALEAPAFALTLRFAGEGAKDVRIDAECIDILLLDLTAPRRARQAPNHSLD